MPTTATTFRGTTKRTAMRRALEIYHYQTDRARAAVVRLEDGTFAVRRVVSWAAVATIPMPVRQPDAVYMIGARGSIREM